MESLHRLQIALLVPPLRARDHREFSIVRGRGRLHHGADPGRVDRHRLLHEDVLATLHRRREVLRTETRRRREDHHVAVGADHLLERVESRELSRLGNIHPGLLPLAQVLEAALETIGKEIAHRVDPHVRTGFERVDRRPGASPAASDETDVDDVLATESRPENRRRGGDDRRNGGGESDGADEVTSSKIQVIHRRRSDLGFSVVDPPSSSRVAYSADSRIRSIRVATSVSQARSPPPISAVIHPSNSISRKAVITAGQSQSPSSSRTSKPAQRPSLSSLLRLYSFT